MSGSVNRALAQPDPANTSFIRRRIDVMLTLGKGGATAQPGPGQAGDTVMLQGLRVSAGISKAGGISQGALSLRIYGLSRSTMNKFSNASGTPVTVPLNNVVTVLAGDDLHGMNMVYQGSISGAWGDYGAQPDVAFVITGLAALQQAVLPVPATSYRGGADVASIMSKLAQTMGLKFENGGVKGITLADPYFPGTAYEQAERCAQHAGIHMTVDDGVLAIWPPGGARTGSVPLISPETGLKGYPTRTSQGIELETLFMPTIRIGARVKVQCSITPACGIWKVNSLDHSLESETANGAWFSRISCVPVGFIPD